MSNNRVYIAGPMTGIPHYNFPAFFEAENTLSSWGFEPVNPANKDVTDYPDIEEWPEYATGTPSTKFSLAKAMHWDITQILECDGIVLLPGWEASKGANIELTVAKACGKEIWVYRGDHLSKYSPDVERTVSSTGGQKETKLARFDLVPPGPLWNLAEHYGRGAKKYSSRNWERGYEWSKSYQALQRHLVAWWNGQDCDPELGNNHLDAAAFHVFALMEFTNTHPEFDDRPHQVVE